MRQSVRLPCELESVFCLPTYVDVKYELDYNFKVGENLDFEARLTCVTLTEMYTWSLNVEVR